MRNHIVVAVSALLLCALQQESRAAEAWIDSFPIEACTHATTGSNRYFILEPGYQIILASNVEQVAITVLNETEMVNGVETRVIEEREWANGKLMEVSRNFFTICREHRDVFYHGEDVDTYQDGKIIAHMGAWRAGVDGARAGLMMPAQTPVALQHYQEIAPGIAMDRAEIVADNVTFETPTEDFHACLKVLETSPLEPEDVSIKLYAPDVGMIFDDDLIIVDRGLDRTPPTAPMDVSGKLGGAFSEVEIAATEMPAIVAALLGELHPTGIIHEVKRERHKDGKIVYAIEIFIDGHQWDVETTPDGTILRNEAEPQKAGWVDVFPIATCTHATAGSNRYFILEPGYQIILASNVEQVAMTVLNETETVDGIETRVLEEREFANGKLKEVSRNFFTICEEHGDVFYHGEEVDVYQDGEIIGHTGEWRAGVDGARAGLMMPAQTPVGLRHYQEVAPGIAMDRARIVADDVIFETPKEPFWECLKVLETSPLEPGEESVKLYAPDVGMIFDDGLVIIDSGRNRTPPSEPVAVPADLGGA